MQEENKKEVLIIKGGKTLRGKVKVSGSKNAVLPLMACSVLLDDEFIIKNVPDLLDIFTMMELLQLLGVKCRKEEERIFLKFEGKGQAEAPYYLVKKMRASILVLGPLLARYGRARVALPGGCSIGTRPVNLHLKGLEKMGAEIEIEKGDIVARAKNLKGAHIYLDFPTVGGTENLIMAGVFAEGETIIENCAKEPEIVELSRFLRTCGALIEGEGTDVIRIKGVKKLKPPREWNLIPDRIEAGTFLIAGALMGDPVIIDGIFPEHLNAVFEKIRECNGRFEIEGNSVKVWRSDKPLPTIIKTSPYPGFPTDMQAQMCSFLCFADGESIIHETIFENRFQYVPELLRMGASIIVEDRTAFIKGVKKLYGAPVTATDLRASASLVLAGLRAEGETIIYNVNHLDRGYEKIENKLQKIGADIRRVRSEKIY